MHYRSVSVGIIVVLGGLAIAIRSEAQVLVTPNTSPPPLQNVQAVAIDASAGSHYNPNVDGPLISYSSNAEDGTGIHLRYFTLGVDTTPHEIPFGPGEQDFLPKVDGTRIAYVHAGALGLSINIFDTAQSLSATNPFTIDPQVNANRFSPAVRGSTVAYIDATPSFDASGQGELVVFDTATNTATRLTNDAAADLTPNLSPDGRLVVWEKCPVDTNHCDIWKAVNVGGTWLANAVTATDDKFNPDTNGESIVYWSVSSLDHVFFQDAGGIEHQLVLPGNQAAPRIAGDLVVFEGQDAGGVYDIFLYQISTNRLWNVTNSPLTDDLFAGVSVLPDGDVMVAYASRTADPRYLSVSAVRFTLPPVTPSYGVCPLYDATKAKKSGSTYPIQIQLCDAAGHNLSSPSIVVHAVGVTQLSTNAPGTLDDAGNSNPDFDFRYDATLGGYIFNLKTTGFATGTYALNFTAGADPAIHSANFQIK